MTRERIIRMVAGTLVLTSLALGSWVSPYWFLLGAFVGANLFQSALTRWCLMEDILKMAKVKSDAEVVAEQMRSGAQPAAALGKVSGKAA